MTLINNITNSYGKSIDIISIYLDENYNINYINKNPYHLKTPYLIRSDEILFIVKEKQKLNNVKNKLINIYSYELDANVKELNSNKLNHFINYKKINIFNDINFNITNSILSKYNSIIIIFGVVNKSMKNKTKKVRFNI